MTEKYLDIDLHTHSTASDGLLSPKELVDRAIENGVKVLALTDHDTCSGITEAKQQAKKKNLLFIPGIELSATWKRKYIHVVGLGVDPTNKMLLERKASLLEYHRKCNAKVDELLEEQGVTGIHQRAVEISKCASNVKPWHFANVLVERSLVTSLSQGMSYYFELVKKSNILTVRTDLKEAVSLILSSHGTPVLAHPFRYNLNCVELEDLVKDFKEYGGSAIEILYKDPPMKEIETSVNLAKKYQLLGSVGSDFHRLTNDIDVGRVRRFPEIGLKFDNWLFDSILGK